MPLEPLENSGKQAPQPQNGDFAALLKRHLEFGTRPGGSPDRPGRRWNNKEFAAKFGHDERTVRNWREGRSRPNDISGIERELFGDGDAYAQSRIDLRMAYAGHRQPKPNSDIPPPPAYFIGREKDVTAILDVLLDSSVSVAILVQGGPGIGKTSLTQAVGNHPDIIDRFKANGRWFVPLDTVASAAATRAAITQAVGGDPSCGFDATLNRLRQRPGLLILDNLETPWDPTAERPAVEEMLAALVGIPGLALLTSFRGGDRVGGPAWSLVHSVAQLDPPDDAELFCGVAQARFADDPHLADFMAALGGIPLAIELVAARAHGRASLAALWTQWTRIGTELAANPDFAAGRLTSLPHSIELSLASSRMTPAAWRLFALLGQLPAGLAQEDRDGLMGDEGFEAEEVLLRTRIAVERGKRLDLLPPIRDYAARRFAPTDFVENAWPAHYLSLTQHLGETISTSADEGAIVRLAPELRNIESAIRSVLAANQRLKAMTALNGFGRLTYIAALQSNALEELAEACRTDGDIHGEADCIQSIGEVALARSEHLAARAAFERALPLYRQKGSLVGQARSTRRLAEIALRHSDHATARELYSRALSLNRKVKSKLGEANCVRGLGEIALRESNLELAHGLYVQALKLYLPRDILGRANCTMGLGDIALLRCNFAVARKAFVRALSSYVSGANVLGEANCVRRLGTLALHLKDHAAARDAFEQALPLYNRIGHLQGEANCVRGLGDLELALSHHAAARADFKKALCMYCEIGDLRGKANCFSSLGYVALALLEHAAARTAFQQARPLYRQAGDARGEQDCLNKLHSLNGD